MLCTYKEGTGDCQVMYQEDIKLFDLNLVKGDSGGPLFFSNPVKGRYEQIGIVSWGHGCAFKVWPGVYVKLSQLLIWLGKNNKDSVYCSG